MPANQPKLLIFDCDGVLIDSEFIVSKVEAEEFARIGYTATAEETMYRFAGVPEHDMYEAVERELGSSLPSDLSGRIDAAIREAYLNDLVPLPGVRETILALDTPICVASSSKPNRLGLGLSKTELFSLFYPHIFSTVLVENGKPAPDLFLYAAERMGVSPRNCVVIEDSVAGVKAAKAAGMTALGFAGGSHSTPALSSKLIEAGAMRVFSAFKDLPVVLEEVAARSYSSDSIVAAATPPR